MTRLYCGEDHEHRCFVATEPSCGCLASVSVLTHREAEAYAFAAKEAKAGLTVREMTVAEFRAIPLHCPEHPEGPPWWKTNGGNGKRPQAITLGLGL